MSASTSKFGVPPSAPSVVVSTFTPLMFSRPGRRVVLAVAAQVLHILFQRQHAGEIGHDQRLDLRVGVLEQFRGELGQRGELLRLKLDLPPRLIARGDRAFSATQ